MNFVVQAWEESERGWGVRPDGLSIHLESVSIKKLKIFQIFINLTTDILKIEILS